MIRNFFSTPNVLGRLMIILLFAGGLVFAGAYDGFVIETEAQGCCGSGTDTATLACGTDALKCSSSSSTCKCESGTECGSCSYDDACDGKRKGCSSNCNYPSNCHECDGVCGGPNGSERSGGSEGCCTEKLTSS